MVPSRFRSSNTQNQPDMQTLSPCSYGLDYQPTHNDQHCLRAFSVVDLSSASEERMAWHAGSGKTLAFLVPLLMNHFSDPEMRGNGITSLILSPTRELAAQTGRCLGLLTHNLTLSCTLLSKGTSLASDFAKVLARRITGSWTAGRNKKRAWLDSWLGISSSLAT
jgi:hypothetical protein